jgi:uncharacterized protein (TIGR00251 family)
MIYEIKVTAGAKTNQIKIENDLIRVYVTAKAVDGKANKAVIELLSEHFSVKKRQIEITKGLKSRNKTVSISG